MLIRKCIICGKEFQSRGKHNVYCSTTCSDIEKKRREKERYGKKKSGILEVRRKPQAEKPGKVKQTKDGSLEDLNRLARERHMSYGQYVAMMEARKERALIRQAERKVL